MTPLVIANFKSQKTASEIELWLKQVGSSPLLRQLNVAVAPAFPYLFLSSSIIYGGIHAQESLVPKERSDYDLQSKIQLAAQNVSSFPPGAYTGEVNTIMLKDLGVRYCLIGHSERRRYAHESNQDIVNKLDNLHEAGITPVLCVDADNYLSQLSLLNASQKANLVVAYEPLEAIGTGNPADPENVSSILTNIAGLVGRGTPLLYGGSVSASTVGMYRSIELVGGFLVGSASLDSATFLSLLEQVAAHE